MSDEYSQRLLNVRDDLDKVSPSFCLAKWMQVTLHLHSGYNHSCHHPGAHKIELHEIQKDPSALHNTSFKKLQRQLMKDGLRPAECQYCWNIENLGQHVLSDRTLKSSEKWAYSYLDQVTKMSAKENINPSYVEVNFSNVCQFSCSYCSANFSTRWDEENKRLGPFSTKNGQRTMEIFTEEENPYIEAFWKWWPELVKTLRIFRITGGEPLLSPNTFRVLESLRNNPHPELEFMINSNLGVSEASFQKYLQSIETLLAEGKIKKHSLFTSVDAWGERAEYIRHGLKFDILKQRIETFLERIPDAQIIVMVTFNALSVSSFIDFAKYVLDLKKKFNREGINRISMDLSYLRHPEHQSIQILPESFEKYLVELYSFIKANESVTSNDSFGFHYEVIKSKRILELFRQKLPEEEVKLRRKYFYQFFSEHDQRRNTNFLQTFPEMSEFWQQCQS